MERGFEAAARTSSVPVHLTEWCIAEGYMASHPPLYSRAEAADGAPAGSEEGQDDWGETRHEVLREVSW